MFTTTDLTARLAETIRIVADFPKPGISFKDITPVFFDPQLVRACASALADPFRSAGIAKVIGIESRGFLLGPLVAQELDCGFVLIRKKGKLPGQTHEVSYDLEYGSATIEAHHDALHPGDRVLIHDDLLATGGTAEAAARLCTQNGATVLGFLFLVELESLQGRQRLEPLGASILSLISYRD
jgi:adenine phosphoribosyltransferase